VDSDAQVLAGYRAPSGRVLDKVIHHLDDHCRAFIRLSPFVTLATASPDGWPEVSPRGGDAGFVHVLDGDFTEFGRPPLSLLVVQVERAYFQCSKAVMRSGLWDPERRVERSVFPPLSQVLRDHCRDDTIPDEATLRAELALEL
jgi:predicted pyridoxine 5'-phosphate oxidase superfamily flavin-nucleotide-binding protein